MNSPVVVPATEADLPALASLAEIIWRQHYPGIISSAQVEYMLRKMYSLDVLRDEIRAQGILFYRMLVDDRFVGFASLGPVNTAGTFKLHKLYLLAEFHGRGLGSIFLNHCENEVMRLGADRLVLAVNKGNSKAIAAYRRNGFEVAESAVNHIGGGFVMDDFIMAKELNHCGKDTAA